jgi:hypothetical protein
MPYKATSWFILGQERFFVIPADERIDQLVFDPNSRSISEKVTAQTCDMGRAKLIAEALNFMEGRGNG